VLPVPKLDAAVAPTSIVGNPNRPIIEVRMSPVAVTRTVLGVGRAATRGRRVVVPSPLKVAAKNWPALRSISAWLAPCRQAHEAEHGCVDRPLHVGFEETGPAVIDGAADRRHEGQEREPEHDGGGSPLVPSETLDALHAGLPAGARAGREC
jgi:hypothetical protein